MIKITLENEGQTVLSHYEKLCHDLPGKTQNVLDMFDSYIKTPGLDRTEKKILKHLKSKVVKDKKTGFSIITARPDQISAFIKNFEALYPPPYSDNLKKNLKYIFYYKQKDKWEAYALAKKIKATVCPYCNRSYTFTIGDDIIKGTRFEYDHFYSQEDYPYLGLSFYNLVPSCHICNANLKYREKFSFTDNMHPYVEGFGDDITFSILPKSIDFYNGIADSYDIRLIGWKKAPFSKAKKALNNVKVFRLIELYNLHKDYVDDIIAKSKMYNSDYVDTLYAQYGGTLFSSKDDIRRNIMGNYTTLDDSGRRPLAKLTRDICNELVLF